MSESNLQTRLAAIGEDGYVDADEVLFLRRSVFADGIVSPTELDALFDLGARAPTGDPEWLQFFAEAAADFYLREEEPEGYLTQDEFISLKARVTRHHESASEVERCLLVKLMEMATQTPQEMSQFVGDEIKNAILNKPGGPAVDKNDSMLLRRFLFASGGDDSVGVTRDEAELLFDINDAVQNADNSAAWQELFVQGIINHLMANLGYTAPSREEAFRRNAWVRDHSVNIGGFFKRMVSGGVRAVKDSYASESVYEEHNANRDAVAAKAEALTGCEADWISDRIGRDGALDKNERELLGRIKDLKDELPENLKALLTRAA